jgi:hypothetical protein
MAAPMMGMQQVEVEKPALMEKLRNNRNEHRAVFLAAQGKYKTAVIAELEQMLEDARIGKRVRRAVSLEAPVDHTSDYDRVLEMLAMSVHPTVTVTATEFECYVLDRWPWARHFAANTMSYGIASKYADEVDAQYDGGLGLDR